MPNVPIYQPGVQIQDPGVPQARVEPMTPAASGANVSEAAAGIGKTVEELASRLEQHIVMQRRMDAQQQVYDRASDVQKQLQEKAYGEGGWLTRQGAQAKGITYGGLPQSGRGVIGPQRIDPDSFEGVAERLKTTALSGLSPYQAKTLTRLIDSHINVMRGAVIRHEADQTNLSQHQSMEAQVSALKDTGIASSSIKDLNSLIEQAQGMREEFYRNHGATPDALKITRQETADEFANAAVKGNLEKSPEDARRLLEGIGGSISNAKRAELQSLVDGKMLDLHRNAVWKQVSGMLHPDGTADVGAMEKQAQKLAESLPVGQRQHVVDFVRSQAGMYDAALRDKQASRDREFFNDAITAQRNGLTYDQAHARLFKGKGYGFDQADILDKEHQLQSLYIKDESFYDNMMKHQTPAQKLMWDQIDSLAEAKYGKRSDKLPGDDVKTPTADAFKIEMRHQLMGLPPEQMWKRANESLKDVVTKPGYLWDTTVPAWQRDRDVRNVTNLEMASLESQYGPLVQQARTYLQNQGSAQPSAKDIQTLIERLHAGR